MSLRDMFVGISFQDKASKAIDKVDNSMDKAADGAQDLGKHVDTAEKKVGFLGTTAGKVAGLVGGLFAIDTMKNFGVSSVEAAAGMQALNAQFDQVFGADAQEASGTVDELGESFGMLPNRIKPAFTSMTSMFKGLGLNTDDAMGTAERAVSSVADAAAFYDKSFEDANSALNSFIKGNYEGGESIGLFANETQLAAFASDELGLEWKKLGEADKQLARLTYAEKMLEAAGATGQAARESDSYENQLGNLKQSWNDFKAALATPVIGFVVSGLKNLSAWVSNIDTEGITSKFRAFGSYMSDTFSPLINDTKAFLGYLWDEFEDNGGLAIAKTALDGFKDGLAWLRDNGGVITAAIAGVTGALAAFRILTFINSALGVMNTLMIAYRSGTLLATLAQYGLNTALLASPLTWVAVAIGAVIAAGVLLYKNWDTVKAAAQTLWDKLKVVWTAIEDGFTAAWNSIKSAGETAMNSVIGGINALIEKINQVPGVEVPVIAKVDWSQTEEPKKGKKKAVADGSHAVGLARVPFDGYMAETHEEEAILTAKQSNALRSAGILKENGDGTPTLDMRSAGERGAVSPAGNATAARPSLTISQLVIQGTGNVPQDIKRMIEQAHNEYWESFERRNPQITVL